MTESSADNPAVSVDCATESLQAAIETSPLHGRTEITISGACVDDISIRRSGITIKGLTGPGTDSITGNLTGFSSDPADSYNLPAGGGALVQKTLSAAVRMSGRTSVVLRNMTINAGANKTAVKARRNSGLKLVDVTLNGGQDGVGLHSSNSDVIVKNTTITGDGNGTTAVSFFPGSALLVDSNSVLEIREGNTFIGGDAANDDATYGLVATSNSSVRLVGVNNSFISGAPVGPDDEPLALQLELNSSLTQTFAGANNIISGEVSIQSGSHVHFDRISISGSLFDIVNTSSVTLEPSNPGDVVLTLSEGIELDSGASLKMGDDGVAVIVNCSSAPCTMRLLGHSTVKLDGSHQINMDVQLFRGSSIAGDSGDDNSKINGTLEVHGFSSFIVTDQDAAPAVAGGTTCVNGEAFKFTAADPGVAFDLCTTAE